MALTDLLVSYDSDFEARQFAEEASHEIALFQPDLRHDDPVDRLWKV